MRTLPIRFWLWLLLVAVVAVPAITTLTLIAARMPPPPPGSKVVSPELRAALLDNVARWSDAAWQAEIAPNLDAAGVDVVLVDAEGQVVYRTAGWPDANPATSDAQNVALSLAATTLMAPGPDGLALAVLAARPAAPRALPGLPWSDTDFWLIPLAQMATLLLIVGAIALFVDRAFLQPLARMIEAMRQVGGGDLDARLPGSRVREVNDVLSAFGAMSGALRASLERQEALEQERRMTIGAVVHDLRTPLFSLRGYLQGLATGLADSPEKAARYVRVCQEKADALERLVSDLFAYTRTEYLEEVPRPEPLELGDLLRKTVEGLQPQAAAKGLRLVLDSAAEPAMVAGDAALLTRAVENILDNAVRHTPAGGTIWIAWHRIADDVIFSVIDSGPGIPDADLPQLFLPLFRGETSRNRRTGGAGLGLAIARRLLRAHGGELTAANAPGRGAAFTGSLPMMPAHLQIAGNSAPQEAMQDRPPDSRPQARTSDAATSMLLGDDPV